MEGMVNRGVVGKASRVNGPNWDSGHDIIYIVLMSSFLVLC
jgi:hypothetical protein